ncbi:MAG: hypothetical protein FJ344_07085 [Sphingomonadales bacterium]|nr:hypothetical protein [Sphingomonadales bacterium]
MAFRIDLAALPVRRLMPFQVPHINSMRNQICLNVVAPVFVAGYLRFTWRNRDLPVRDLSL